MKMIINVLNANQIIYLKMILKMIIIAIENALTTTTIIQKKNIYVQMKIIVMKIIIN